MKKLFAAVLICFIFHSAFAADTLIIKSPSGITSFKLFTVSGQLTFSVIYGNITVIENSNLGVTIDGNPMTSQVKMGKVTNYAINETYDWFGVHNPAINRCTGRTITLINGATT